MKQIDQEIVAWDVATNGAKPLHYPTIQAQLKFLMGRVLTIIDASYKQQEQEQRKAVKDLVKNEFSRQLSWIFELCGYPENQSVFPVPNGKSENTK